MTLFSKAIAPISSALAALARGHRLGYRCSYNSTLVMVSPLFMRVYAFIACLCLFASGCSDSMVGDKDLAPDRTVVASSHYPTAVDPSRVGSYPALTKSGAGYFYDDVLEYRVWMHPKGGGDDCYRAFASYEPALQYSKSTVGAEEPLVVVRQKKWINEPEKGKFEPRSDERITEWQTVWLSQGTKRNADSIDRFLKEKMAETK